MFIFVLKTSITIELQNKNWLPDSHPSQAIKVYSTNIRPWFTPEKVTSTQPRKYKFL